MLEATLRQNEKLIGAKAWVKPPVHRGRAARGAGQQVPKMGGAQDNSTKGEKRAACESMQRVVYGGADD
jgi:hypothetical protein